jgi:hypothetical protein
MKPGLHDMPAEEYHADPCEAPSLSSSIAKILLAQTPRHAWFAHPRLNPAHEPTNKTAFDIGHAAHSLLLEGEGKFEIIDARNFQTKAAREARDDAYDAGKTPLIADDYARVKAMVAAAKAQIALHEDLPPFDAGKPEQTCIWRHYEIWCRVRFDWLSAHHATIIDYKTTTDANPDTWQRRCFDLGADVQEAFYRYGARKALDIPEARFVFIVQEISPPYALSVVELTPAAKAMADAKIHRALELWGDCMARDRWPGYPATTAYIEAPVYAAARWEDTKAREEIARDAGGKLIDMMIDWQAPHTEEDAA